MKQSEEEGDVGNGSGEGYQGHVECPVSGSCRVFQSLAMTFLNCEK